MGWTGEGPSLFAFSAGMLGFATLAVALRFVCRGYILRVLGLSDLCMLLTLYDGRHTGSSSKWVVIHPSSTFGIAKPPHQLADECKLVVNLSVVLTKISVLLLFLDIFLTSWPRKATHVLIPLTSVFGICDAVTNIFACLPINSFWNLDRPDHRCISIGEAKSIADAVISFVLDVAIFCLPLPLIWPMTLPVCAASGVRIYLVMGGIGIPTGEASLPYWVATEINLAIVVACIPTLRLLVVKIWPRLLETTGDAKTSRDSPISQPEQER
ncbi:hypothetical protein F5144DRAFT_588129 [Chaetomium tenue]|uniref:Uncharacterized protein n=1 Tax=Chaetomium tenue TaxID=1854479 RepID=A0ACB7PKV1_9PEZI|nr:hypothetical protein F5144DRAFT_588129 [Chaetomium globosum]